MYQKHASVAELVDAMASKAFDLYSRAGSIPAARTKNIKHTFYAR